MTNKPPQIQKRTGLRWLSLAIILLGAFLRLAAFQEALVGADQSSILAAAADIAALRDFPGVGIKSSLGVMQTAVPAYLAAIPLLVLHRIIAVSWFYGILDVLAIAALYRAVGRTFSRRAAAIAALLYATNPWVVEFNRWIWYQSLIPTFATFAYAALLSSLRKGPQRQPLSVAATMVSACLMGLVHLAALPWAALLELVAIITAVVRRWYRAAILGLVGAILVAAPYLLFLVRGGLADVEIILNDATGDAGARNLNTASYRLSLELLSGRQVLSTPRNDLWGESVLRWEPLYLVIPLLLGTAVAWGVLTIVRRGGPNRRAVALTLIWTLLAPALFLPTDVHLQHFYLLFIFPAPFVLIGAAVDETLPSPRRLTGARLLAGLGTAAFGAVLLASAWWAHLWIVRIGYEQKGQLRAPTRAWLMDQAVGTIADYLASTPSGEVIVLTHFGGESSPFDWMRNFLGTDRVRVVPAGEALIVPPSEVCYMVAERATADQLAPLEERLVAAPQMTVPASPPWSFYCGGPRQKLPTPIASWQNGLALLSSEIEGDLQVGGQLRIANTWHYSALTDGEYHFFNHLMSGDELVAQVDGDGLPTRYWRDDDILVTYFTLPLPDTLSPGAYDLRLGAYTWPGIVRVQLRDGDDALTVARWVR